MSVGEPEEVSYENGIYKFKCEAYINKVVSYGPAEKQHWGWGEGLSVDAELAQCLAMAEAMTIANAVPEDTVAYADNSSGCINNEVTVDPYGGDDDKCDACDDAQSSSSATGDSGSSCSACSAPVGAGLGGSFHTNLASRDSSMGPGWQNGHDIRAGKAATSAGDLYTVAVAGAKHLFHRNTDGTFANADPDRRAQIVAVGGVDRLRVRIGDTAYEFDAPVAYGEPGLTQVAKATRVVAEEIDAVGNVSYRGFDTAYAYPDGRLATVTTDTGESYAYSYNADGLLTAINNGTEDVFRFSYADPENPRHLTSRWQRGYGTTDFTYTSKDGVDHLLAGIYKPGGVNTEFVYDAAVAVDDILFGTGAKVLASYHRAENLYSGPQTTEVYHYEPTEPDGSYTEYRRPLADGTFAVSRVHVAKAVVHPVYGSVYRHVSVDENGARTTSWSNAQGTLETQTVGGVAPNQLWRTAKYQYDADGNLLRSVARNLEAISPDTWDEINTYDSFGRLVKTVKPSGDPERPDLEHHVQYLAGINGGMDARKAAEWDQAGEYQINRVEYEYYPATAPVHQRHRLWQERRKIAENTFYVVEHDYIQTDNDNPQNVGKLWKKTYPDTSCEEWTYENCCGATAYRDRTGATTAYSRDLAGRLLSETAPSGAMTTYTYDAAGRVLVTALPTLGTVTNAYDAQGRIELVEYSDSTSESRTYRTDGDGQLATETSRAGLVTTYHYSDTDGSLTSVTTSGGTLQAMTYDGLGRIETQTDARGLVLSYGYDDYGNRETTTWPDSTFTLQGFDAAGRLLASQDRLERVTEFEYDDFDRQTAVVLPNGLRRETEYDALSRVVATSLTDGTTTLTTAYILDADGNPTLIEYSDSTEESFTYTGGRLETRTDRASQTWTYTYTAAGQPDQVLAPGDLVVSDLDYSNPANPNNGLPTASTGPDGVTVAYTYDTFGRRTRETMPDTPPTHSDTEYGPSGPTAQIDRANQRTEITYDAYGRRTSVTDPKNQTVSFAYNLAGDLLTLTDARNKVTTWAYDNEGRVELKTYDDASHYHYAWYPDGKLHTRTDAKSQPTSYTWNDLGLLVAINYPNDPDVSYAYDAFGRRTGMTDALSAIGSTSWTYNANGDILTEDGPFTDDTVTYTYASGRKSGMAFSELETSYAYDPMSRVSGVTASNGEAPTQDFAYSFLARSNKVAGVTLNSGPAVANTFDTLGRLTQKTNTFGQTTVSSYLYQLDNADQRVRATFADDKYIAYSYDAAGQLLSAQRHFADDSQDFSYNYAYTFDPMGNPVTKATQGQQRTYTANDLNQLATATAPTSTDVAGQVAPGLATPFTVTVNGQPATVDAVGNFYRLGVPLSAGENQIAVQATDKYGRTDSELRTVTLASAPAFTYDLNGNMTSDGLWGYSWDDENRMVEAESGMGVPPMSRQKVQYRYDGQGRMRLMKSFSWNGSDWTLDSEIRFIYDGTRIIAERDGSDSELRTYTWGLDIDGGLGTAGGVGGLLAVSDLSAPSAPSYFPAYDGNGNITAYLDDVGTVVSQTEYAPFGAVTSQSGQSFPFGFSTQYTAHGLVHYLYRKYNPEFDRWLSRDPIGEEGGDNLYAFVSNNPINKFDYWGNGEVVIATLDKDEETLKPITSVNEIFVKEIESSTESSGYLGFPGGFGTPSLIFRGTDINKPGSYFCKAVIRVIIQAKGPATIGAKGTKYWYIEHGIDFSGEVGGKGFGPRDETIAHERGHAQAFWQIVISKVRSVVAGFGKGPKDVFTEGQRTAINSAFDSAYMSSAHKILTAQLANLKTRAFYKPQIFDRKYPTDPSQIGNGKPWLSPSSGFPSGVHDAWEVK